MSNALIRASHGLTLPEKRIVMWAVSTLDSKRVYGAHEVPTTRVSAIDYAKEYEVSTVTAYLQLKEAAKQLFERKITFYEPAFKRDGKALKPTLVQMRWVGEARYQEGLGYIEISWWPKLMPHLTGIKKQFTTYQLQRAVALRSIFAWRLMDLLMRFKASGVAEYTIEDFCTSIEATQKQSADYGKIRTKIIEPALRELKKNGWNINLETLKAGRKVIGLRFEFELPKQDELPFFDNDEPAADSPVAPPSGAEQPLLGCESDVCSEPAPPSRPARVPRKRAAAATPKE